MLLHRATLNVSGLLRQRVLQLALTVNHHDEALAKSLTQDTTDLTEAEYSFLVGSLLDRETLLQAIAISRQWGVAPHEVLIAQGWITDTDYVEALARHLGLRALSQIPTPLKAGVVLIDGIATSPWLVARCVAERESAGSVVVLALPREIADRAPANARRLRLQRAIAGLLRWRPVWSAGMPMWFWQRLALVAGGGFLAGQAVTEPAVAYTTLLIVLTLAFTPIVVMRLVILALGLLPEWRTSVRARIPDAELPVYSILVPMFREGEVLPDLVAAISAIDYPAAKLDVLLVLESVDRETQEVAASLDLPGFMRVVVVPDSQPRTKPKALNYALQLARGDYVVVYDAEDAPEPDQLRKAISRFRESPARVACLQGRLNIHNVRDSWLTRQFTLEYTVLFDVILPGLARLGLPIPLGGTSNHFPRQVLDRWFGWDPFNVTEDADLGIRLARTGARVEMLSSTTWEEAPARFGSWFRQRTRWIKGWMQTYLVHTRQPLRLMQDLGWAAFVGFHLYSGGLVLSALVFPIFCIMVAVELWQGVWLDLPVSIPSGALWTLAVFNLAAAYTSILAATVVAIWRRGRIWLLPAVLLMPVYWLLISLAAYRAAIQLATAPYYWEKTDHRSRTRRRQVT